MWQLKIPVKVVQLNRRRDISEDKSGFPEKNVRGQALLSAMLPSYIIRKPDATHTKVKQSFKVSMKYLRSSQIISISQPRNTSDCFFSIYKEFSLM